MIPVIICKVSSYVNFKDYAVVRQVSKSWHESTKSPTALPHCKYWPYKWLDKNPNTTSLYIDQEIDLKSHTKIERICICNDNVLKQVSMLPSSITDLRCDHTPGSELLSALTTANINPNGLNVSISIISSTNTRFDYHPGIKHTLTILTSKIDWLHNMDLTGVNTLIFPLYSHHYDYPLDKLSKIPRVDIWILGAVNLKNIKSTLYKYVTNLKIPNARMNDLIPMPRLQELTIGRNSNIEIHCARSRFSFWPELDYIHTNGDFLGEFMDLLYNSSGPKNNSPLSTHHRSDKPYIIIGTNRFNPYLDMFDIINF